MNCETCGSGMHWEGPLRGGRMVCYSCELVSSLQRGWDQAEEPKPEDGYDDPDVYGWDEGC